MIYKIVHLYAKSDEGSVYVESDLGIHEVADIIIGLEFFIEDHTKYGENSFVTEEMGAYLLCNFFGCKQVDRNDIRNYKEYDTQIQDIPDIYHIDLYSEREIRCGEYYEKYEECIEAIKDSEYIRKLCAFYDDDRVFGTSVVRIISSKDILEKY